MSKLIRRGWMLAGLALLPLAGLVLFPVAGAAASAAIPAPEDVAAPPGDAEVTSSGLASKVLRAGTGSEHPGPADVVEVHYTGWTTDGEMFDSSVARGKKVGLPLDRVIAGWTEGLQLMVEGEKRRFWIPEELAYGGKKGKPAGMLVFDVELFRFEKKAGPPPVPADVGAAPADAEVTARAWRAGSCAGAAARPTRRGVAG